MNATEGTLDAAAALTVTAPAKINLALHVTGRRGDGYHLLERFVKATRTGATP